MMVEPWRVAQLAVERGPDRDGSRGSGYLIAPGRVLTAAHMVAGASVVRVRLDVGQDTEVDVYAESWWTDPEGHNGTDLAVVTIPEDATAGREIEPARFGRISDCTAVLVVQAFGFPRFKLRGDPADVAHHGVFRDFEQAAGHAPVAANRRQGTLAVYLDDPPPDRPPAGEPSPWEGMSGGPVWADGRIVAVVAEHHPGEGTGRLTARRIDRAYTQLSAPDLGTLVDLLGLAPAVSALPDVVPAERGQLVRSAYLAQVADIAPDELIGREGELAEWAAFCAGTELYAWWQAGPWAGKTALASWFVTHPPTGVDIVSFFVTGRLYGQADSDAFLDAMIEQLHAYRPAGGGSPGMAGARVGAWLSLLASTATQAEERGRRLVVVVDGLDEDEAGATPPRGRPSIASLLPRRPPSGVRVIVTSRPDPGLPDDAPAGHPLRTCIPHRLPVSWVAKDLAQRGKQELRDLPAGDQTAIDVLGYIAGSGGGLTTSDLSALIGAPPLKLDPILRGVFGRSLQTRASADTHDAEGNPVARVYLFAHETLRVTAEEQLGGELSRYREGIHGWIRSYVRLGWPDTTPGYAIRGYPRLLIATSDPARLSALARDPGRHAFLLRATGSDYAALTEIRNAQVLIAGQNVPDLQALVELAVYRRAISIRNQAIPVALPAVWARLARFDHAESLAYTISSPDGQARALAGLASATAQAGDLDRADRMLAEAEALARAITDYSKRAQALTELAQAAVQAGDLDRADRMLAEAEAVARTIPYSDRARVLAELAAIAAQGGDLDRAETLARAIPETLSGSLTGQDAQALALAFSNLASAAARAGDLDRAGRMLAEAEAVARTITSHSNRARALAGLASAAAEAGDVDRANRMAAEAEALAPAIIDCAIHAEALTELARAAVQAGDLDRADRMLAEAEAIVQRPVSYSDQVRVLARLASAAAQAGDLKRAGRIATQAESYARGITEAVVQAEALTQLARAAVQAGDLDRAGRIAIEAEALARTIISPAVQAQALTELVQAAAQAGDLDRAEALARTIIDPDGRAQALTWLVKTAAQVGDLGRAGRMATEAEAVARTIIGFAVQAQALAGLASAVAQAGDSDRASRMLAAAEAVARTLSSRVYGQGQALAGLARAAAQAGDLDRAEAFARSITEPSWQDPALAELARAAGQAGDLDRAEALARSVTDLNKQARGLAELALAAAQAGDLDRAEALAHAINFPYGQARAIEQLARAAAQAGDLDRAEALARSITRPDVQVWALATVAGDVARAGELDRAEALARSITDPGAQAQAFAGLASGVARAGELDRAEALARSITDPGAQAQALTEMVIPLARAGDLDRAEDLARAITDPGSQARALAQLTSAVAVYAGDLDRAEALAHVITSPSEKAWALSLLARVAVEAGDLDRAEALARAITDPDGQAEALAELARDAVKAGDLDRAEVLARAITSPYGQVRALTNLATAAARAGDLERARHLLALAVSMEPSGAQLVDRNSVTFVSVSY